MMQLIGRGAQDAYLTHTGSNLFGTIFLVKWPYNRSYVNWDIIETRKARMLSLETLLTLLEPTLKF